MGWILPHVVPGAEEDIVLRVSDNCLREALSEKSLAHHVAEFWFDCCSSPEVTFEHLAELSDATDEDRASSLVNAVALYPCPRTHWQAFSLRVAQPYRVAVRACGHCTDSRATNGARHEPYLHDHRSEFREGHRGHECATRCGSAHGRFQPVSEGQFGHWKSGSHTYFSGAPDMPKISSNYCQIYICHLLRGDQWASTLDGSALFGRNQRVHEHHFTDGRLWSGSSLLTLIHFLHCDLPTCEDL